MSGFERARAEREEMELIGAFIAELGPSDARLQAEFALLPQWETGSSAVYGDRVLDLHNHQERIASLEYIVALLLEKTEQTRQQLLAQMD